jgi:Na+/H+ antiporter NhaA
MIGSVVVLFREFVKSEKSSGILLLICTVVSLILANSTIGSFYTGLWHHKFEISLLSQSSLASSSDILNIGFLQYSSLSSSMIYS